jgi:hypothetical protein
MEWDWIHLIQRAETSRVVVNKVTNILVTLNVQGFPMQLRNKKFLKNLTFC